MQNNSKNLTKFVSGGHGLFGLILAAALPGPGPQRAIVVAHVSFAKEPLIDFPACLESNL